MPAADAFEECGVEGAGAAPGARTVFFGNEIEGGGDGFSALIGAKEGGSARGREIACGNAEEPNAPINIDHFSERSEN